MSVSWLSMFVLPVFTYSDAISHLKSLFKSVTVGNMDTTTPFSCFDLI